MEWVWLLGAGLGLGGVWWTLWRKTRRAVLGQADAGPDHRAAGPPVGDLLRFEGGLFRVVERLGPGGVQVRAEPVLPGPSLPEFREVSCNALECVRGRDYRAEVRAEAARYAEAHPALASWARNQAEHLPGKFQFEWRGYWYLPGRVLERHLLREE